MNIFYLDKDPRKAAEYLRDNHIVKMPSESGQLLSAWADAEGWSIKGEDIPHFEKMDYPASVPKHPCSLWLLEGLENVLWTVKNLHWMLVEYDQRYGGQDKYLKSRAMVKVLRPWLEQTFVMRNWTEPKQALGPNGHFYYVEGQPVEGYRRYYIAEKLPGATYKTQPPDWKPYKPPEPKKKISASGLKIGSKPSVTPTPQPTHQKQGIGSLKIKRKD